MTCTHVQSLGVYVVGALDDAERALVDVHVADCPDCRRELERLMPLPGYLACLTAHDVEGIGVDPLPPAGLLTRLRGALRAEHRRLVRLRIAGVAAFASVLVAATAAVQIAGRPPAPVAAARVAAADARSGVRAAVTLTPREWGTELSVRMEGAAPGERCRLVVRARDGSSDVAGTWRATYHGSAGASGSTGLPRAEVAAVDVVTTTGRRLVHVPVPALDRTTETEDRS